MLSKHYWINSDSLGANGKSISTSSFNCSGTMLGAISSDNSVRLSLFDLEAFRSFSLTSKRSSNFFNPYQTINQTNSLFAWHPYLEDRFVLAGDSKTIEVWDAKSSVPSAKLQSSGGLINVCFSPDGNYLAVGSKVDFIQVFDLRTNTLISKKKFNYEVNQFSFTANSDHLITANAAGGAGGIDLLALNLKTNQTEDTVTTASNTDSLSGSSETTLELVTHLSAHSSNCFTLKIDQTFSRLVVGGADLNLSLWDLEDLICVRHIQLEHDARGLSFNHDSTLLSVATETGGILIVDSQDGTSLAHIPVRTQKITSANWHPKYNLMAVSTSDKSTSQPSLRFLGFADID